MADYMPVFLPGEAIPLTASGTISGGDLVVVSGSATVAKAASTAGLRTVIGVAGCDAVANGRVTVYGRGTVHESVADSTVTAGDQVVTSGTSGKQVVKVADVPGTPDQASVNNARALLGIALTTATDGNKVRWMAY